VKQSSTLFRAAQVLSVALNEDVRVVAAAGVEDG
jgi:hypothetical protein